MVRNFLHYPNVLSIDVALGAVCSAMFVGKYLDVEIPFLAMIILFSCVWLIYTTDHLLDAQKISVRASSLRHRFHQEHFSALRNVVIGVAILTALLSFLLPRHLFYAGVTLSGFVALYLLIHRWFSIVKELTVALLYSIGVFLPSLSPQFADRGVPTFFVAFILTAFMNLIVFSWFSYRDDREDGMRSIVTRLGKRLTSSVIICLWVIQILLLWHSGFDDAYQILFAMNTIWLVMFLIPKFFSKHERYRIGDAVFFLSLLYFLS
jgi:hypothetical protein